jgi:hypothetical protein
MLAIMGKDVRSYKASEDLIRIVTLLCRQGNGRWTNNILFTRLTSDTDYHTRKALLEQENYRLVVEKLITANTWNGSSHSHKGYLEHVRGLIQEKELNNFGSLVIELLKNSGNNVEQYEDRLKHFMFTKLLWGLWTLGYSSKYAFLEIMLPVFQGYSYSELEEVLQQYQKEVPFTTLPVAGRDEALKAFNQFLLDLRKQVVRVSVN